MFSSQRARCVWLVAAALMALPITATAQPGVTGDVVRQARTITESLMSPYCPGLTLAVRSSPGAAALRDELLIRLKQGEAEAAVVASLVERFGSRVTGLPQRGGFE